MPMLSDFKPIIYNAPREAKEIVIHFIHDPHYGNECFDKARWERIVKDVQQDGHLYCLIGRKTGLYDLHRREKAS